MMEITGLQIIFILIALVEWIFTESTDVIRGYLAEGWKMPEGLGSIRYAAVFGILFAYFVGGRLIYRKKSGRSQPMVLRTHGILWASFFYIPYLSYSFMGNMIFLFREKGRAEGVIFFLANMLAFICLAVKLYKMPKERRLDSSLQWMDPQKAAGGQNTGERLFRVSLVGVFILMWAEPVFLRFQDFFLLDMIPFLRLAALIYIVIWLADGKHGD